MIEAINYPHIKVFLKPFTSSVPEEQLTWVTEKVLVFLTASSSSSFPIPQVGKRERFQIDK